MSKLEKAYHALLRMESGKSEAIFPDPIVAVPLIILYLCLLLSVPLIKISVIIWLGIYPIISCNCSGLSYGKILIQSLIIVPLCILIGIFNPYYETAWALTVGSIRINEGWISMASIVLRGIFGLQSVLILVECSGFISICRALRRLGMPAFLTDQLQFVYRYVMAILQEAITMNAARAARGYGRKTYPMKMWATFIGQLLLRSLDRSERISKAMMARGFTGVLPDYFAYINESPRLSKGNLIYLLTWCIILPLLRFIDLSSLFFD